MSTIGTTLKQPRVFAHDAIALNALCGNTSGTIVAPGTAVTLTAPDVDGTGYGIGGPHATVTNGGGSGATVTINVVGAGGEVTDFDITAIGQDYEVGDSLTVQSGNNDCIIFITETGCSAWALGDPITQMPNEALGSMNSVPYWNEKMAYTYTMTTPGPAGTFQTPGPGAAIYVGAAMDITVVNEAGTTVEYKGVNAGSFLPVSVLTVKIISAGTTADVLALY